jgi:hypothetical protein
MSRANRYEQIIERIFLSRYEDGATQVEFERTDIERVAADLGIPLPKNLGDLIYSFRYRVRLPVAIRERAPEGTDWIIRPAGRARYRFVATTLTNVVPNPLLTETKVPDATPGVIAMYALSDEQALLAKVRYNRLIDVFSGVSCYSLQSHLRTTVPDIGQVKTDEIYVGVDRRGAHFVFPVQAKGGTDHISIVQIEQDFALCATKFPALICRPVATQFMATNLIALFDFEMTDNGVALVSERHYRLVPPGELTSEDLEGYRMRPS